MATPDMDVIKEIPGYKVILKAVLKSQIQQLVEQLAKHTEEESIILTASVADGTLSHLGSTSGKSFLEDHEDVKSQFLGFCLKWHHKRQQEKEREEAIRKAVENTPPIHYIPIRSPQHISPRFHGPRGQMFQSPGFRHQPYPVTRPVRAYLQSKTPPQLKGLNSDNQVIKIEHDNGEDVSNQSDKNSLSVLDLSQPPSPSQTPASSSHVKNELSDKEDDDAHSDSSASTIPKETLPEGLSLDSDLSNLISGAQTSKTVSETHGSSDVEPDVSIKLEAVNESEMDLEITGVEPGRTLDSQANWTPNTSMGMNYDLSGATGSQVDMQADQQGYRDPLQFPPVFALKLLSCDFCGKHFLNTSKLLRHVKIHTGEKNFKCNLCGRCFTLKHHLKNHLKTVHEYFGSTLSACE